MSRTEPGCLSGARKRMNCPSNSVKHPGDGAFRGDCGQTLTVEPPCRNCGRPNAAGLRFCRGRGIRLAQGKAPTPEPRAHGSHIEAPIRIQNEIQSRSFHGSLPRGEIRSTCRVLASRGEAALKTRMRRRPHRGERTPRELPHWRHVDR